MKTAFVAGFLPPILAWAAFLSRSPPISQESFLMPDSQRGDAAGGMVAGESNEPGRKRFLIATQVRYSPLSRSIFAAIMKSLSVKPLILCVHSVISALPQASRMSG